MFDLPLSKKLASQRWKVKIWDNEIRESPHITIICKTNKWRWGLREREFLDDVPDPSLVAKGVMTMIEEHFDELCEEWNKMHPSNPVAGIQENENE